MLVALAENLVGDPLAAERAVRDAEAIVSGPGDRWYQSMVNVDLAHAIIAQGRDADAAAAVVRIDTAPAPCDREWLIKRHAARARVAMRAGDEARSLEEARTAVARAEPTGLVLVRADVHRTLAEALHEAGHTAEAVAEASRAPALDERKANVVAAATTRRVLASLGAQERA